MEIKDQVEELSRGFQKSIIFLTACKIGLFEALADGAASPDEIARQLKVHPRALETVMLALVAVGVLSLEEGRFRVTEEYKPFVTTGSSESQASIFKHNFNIMKRWAHLDEVLRTGVPIPRESFDPHELRDFICGMADISRHSSVEVAEKIDLGKYRRMLDVGGGPGTAAITFAQRNPQLSAVVYDLPPVTAIAQEEIDKAGLGERVTVQPGDYFKDELGSGFDLVYISNIIHSVGPGETMMLAAKAYRALEPNGTLIIKDFFLDETRTKPVFAAIFSVNMLVGTESGKSYSVSETREILEKAGFSGFEVIEVASASKLLIARKV